MSTKAKRYLVVNKRNGVELRRIYDAGKGAETIEQEGAFDNYKLVSGTVVVFKKGKPEIVGRTTTHE